jgi:hypothetical protein
MARGTGKGCTTGNARPRSSNPCQHTNTVEIGRMESRTDSDVDIEIECVSCGARTSTYTPSWGPPRPKPSTPATEAAARRLATETRLASESRKLNPAQAVALRRQVKRNGSELWLSKLGSTGIVELRWHNSKLPPVILTAEGRPVAFTRVGQRFTVPPAPRPTVISDCKHSRTFEVGRMESRTDYDVDVEIECSHCGARTSTYTPYWGSPRPKPESKSAEYARIGAARVAAIEPHLNAAQLRVLRREIVRRGPECYASKLGKTGIVMLAWPSYRGARADLILTSSGRASEFRHI